MRGRGSGGRRGMGGFFRLGRVDEGRGGAKRE